MRDILFHPAASLAVTLLLFLLLPWPGYAVLHVTGWGRGRTDLPLLFAPAVTLALFVIVLSGAAWLSIPLEHAARPVWIGALVCGSVGATLFFWDRRPTAQQAGYLFLSAIIALAVTPSIFRLGIGYFVGSVGLDGWSYVAVAEYLTHVPRGVDSGLSSLHQYGSHLLHVRNATSSLLAQLAIQFGTMADEVVALYCASIVFANACALAAFASVMFKRADLIVAYLLLAGIAMPALIIACANLDQLLVLPILAAMAAIAVNSLRQSMLGTGFVLGILMAASALAYIEMAFLGLLVALSFALTPGERFKIMAPRIAATVAIAVPIAVLLASPGIAPLIDMLKGQYTSSIQHGARPGEGMFANWIMGGDFLKIWWVSIAIVLAAFLSTITALGVYAQRQRWGAVVSFFVVATLSAHFLINEKYLYAVYKIVTVNFWMFCFFTVAGAEPLLRHFYRPTNTLRLGTAAFASIAVAAIGMGTLLDYRQAHTADLQRSYREALLISDIIKSAPILLSVVDRFANQWAVLYLSASPMIISPYRNSMSQAHVIPVMDRAKSVDRNDVRFIVTDRDDGSSVHVKGASRVWTGSLYSLWKVESPEWSVHVDEQQTAASVVE